MEALQEEDIFGLDELEPEREFVGACDVKESIAEALKIGPAEEKRIHVSATTVADKQWQPPVDDGNLLELSARLAGIMPEVQVSPPSSPASGQHQFVPVMEDVADILLPPDTQGDVADVPDVPFPPPPAGILTPPWHQRGLGATAEPPSTTATPFGSGCPDSGHSQQNPAIWTRVAVWHQLRSSRSLWRQSWAAVSHQRCSSGVLRLWTQAVTPQWGPKQSLPNRRPPRLKDLGMSLAASQPLSSNSLWVPAYWVQKPPVWYNTAAPAQGFCLSHDPAIATGNPDDGTSSTEAGAEG